MSGLSRKQNEEQEVFRRFARRLEKSLEWTEVISRPEPEPDLLCLHVARGPVAFELVSLTDPTIAQVLVAGSKARQDAFVTADPSERIVRSKLKKHYETAASGVELLIYTDGRLITPDNAIIPTVAFLIDTVDHPFKRIWFMGEYETRQLWGDA